MPTTNQPPAFQSTDAQPGVPQQVQLRMVKHAGERSFGMTLEQRFAVSPQEYAAVVSYIFPNSPADRVGIKRGWMLLRINNRSVRGVPVKDVALMFRDHMKVDVELETRVDTAVPMLGGGFNSANVTGFGGNNMLFQASMVPFPPVAPTGFAQPFLHAPVYQQQQFTPTSSFQAQAPCPVAISSAPPATASARVIVSPGSSLGVPPSLAIPEFARVTRVVAAPAMPALSEHVPAAPQPSATSEVNAAMREIVSDVHTQPASDGIILEAPAAVVAEAQQPVVLSASPSESLESEIANGTDDSDPVIGQSASPAQEQVNGAQHSAPSSLSQLEEPKPTSPAVAVPKPAQKAAAPPMIILPIPIVRPAPAAPPVSVEEAKASVPVATAQTNVNRNAVTTLKTEAHEVPPTTPAARVPQEAPHVYSNGTLPSTVTRAASDPTHRQTPTTTTSSGKKRGRPRRDSTSLSSSDNEGAAQRTRAKPRNRNAVHDDSDSDSSRHAYSYNDRDSQSSPEQASTENRRNTRRRGAGGGESTGRARTSLTVDRLVTMGFTREDANASVTACGHNPDACMIWIVSHLEEKKFLEDLNKASIASELSKQAEEKELQEQERETYKKAKAFTALFTTSFMLSSESDATQFKKMLADAIGEVDPDSFLRVVLTKLLKLEAQAIRWYKDASKCYLLQLAQRLEVSFDDHDVVVCCSKLAATAGASLSPPVGGCAFLQALHEEEQSLSKALFDMPENHGGVPLVFLNADKDKDTQFSLDDDGFEVLEADISSD